MRKISREFQKIWPFSSVKRRLRGCCLLVVVGLLLGCGIIFGMSFLLARLTKAQALVPASSDVLLLIDNSNSMFRKQGVGSDPDLMRIEAARLFITYLGANSDGPAHRLGVIFFGDEARVVIPLTPLADETRRAEMIHLLENPVPIPWTNPEAALALAYDTFIPASEGAIHQQAAVLLTDGKPEWSDSPTSQEKEAVTIRLREMAERFARQGIPLFIILLQNEATDADPEIEQLYVPLWQEMAAGTSPGRFYRARESEELLDIYHDLAVTLTGRQTAGIVVQTQVESNTVESVRVEPKLAQVTFVIRKSDPALRVQIVRPDGRTLRSTEAGVQYGGQPGRSREEIWAVANPPPGLWQVQINGQGTVTVWKDFYPVPSPTPTFVPSPSPSRSATPTSRPTATSTAPPSPTSPQPSRTFPPPALSRTPVPVVALPQPTSPENEPEIPQAVAQIAATSATDTQPPRNRSLSNMWCFLVPMVSVGLAGGGWLWLKKYQTRPLLTGVLRLIVAPDLTGPTVPTRLDLDQLNCRELRLGPTVKAEVRLPHASAGQLTPTVKLIARQEVDNEVSVVVTVTEGTLNGAIQVNNGPVRGEQRLRDGDVIAIGGYRFKYENLRQRGS